MKVTIKKEAHKKMNKIFTKEQLTRWIADLQKAAKIDEPFLVDWFKRTKESKFSIVGD